MLAFGIHEPALSIRKLIAMACLESCHDAPFLHAGMPCPTPPPHPPHPPPPRARRAVAGVCNARADNLREAVSDYTAALRYDPWLDSGWCCRGTAYGLLGRTQRAARDHARATELDYRHEACLLTRDVHCSRLNLKAKLSAPH